MRWPWSKRQTAVTNRTLSISDPAVAGYFTPGGVVDLAGVSVSEHSALGLSAFYRALSLISGTLGSLPLLTYSEPRGEAMRKRVTSIFDKPDGDEGQTQFEWAESLYLHLLIHGRTGALKVRTDAGALARLPLVHPLSFRPVLPTVDEYKSGNLPVGGLWFDVQLDDGSQRRFDGKDFWYVPGPSTGGQIAAGLITHGRLSLGTALAADRAAARLFGNGALISGLATPDYDDGTDITDDVPQIRRELDRSTGGHENAGVIAVVNRRLKFTPWTMTAQQAQFLESRKFQIEEISRWTGVPPHLLMQTEKQTSWGTGVDEQNRAMGRTVLGTWAGRFEQRASRLLPAPRYVEHDFMKLERPAPDREIELDLQQVAAGVMTVDEYRKRRGWEPLPAGDVSRETSPRPAPPGQDDDQEDDDDVPAE